jgi:hypothetical protein
MELVLLFFFFGHIHSGAGCAYLVAASHTNLSVFDLLRMELLWSRPAEGANHLVSGVLCYAVLCCTCDVLYLCCAVLCDAMTFFAMICFSCLSMCRRATVD